MSNRKKLKKILAQLQSLREDLDARLARIDASLAQILNRLDVDDQPGSVSDEVWAAYMKPLEDTLAGMVPIAGPPELNSGVSGKKNTNQQELGRVYAQPGSVVERWLLASPSSARDEGVVFFNLITPGVNEDRMGVHDPLGSNLQSGKQATNEFDFYDIPQSGTGTPPQGTVIRYYKLSTVTISANGNTTTESGRMYREIHVDSQGREVWSDHWVLWPNYIRPRLADPNLNISQIDLKQERDDNNAPASVDAFLSTQRDRQAEITGTYLYAHVFLEWDDFSLT